MISGTAHIRAQAGDRADGPSAGTSGSSARRTINKAVSCSAPPREGRRQRARSPLVQAVIEHSCALRWRYHLYRFLGFLALNILFSGLFRSPVTSSSNKDLVHDTPKDLDAHAPGWALQPIKGVGGGWIVPSSEVAHLAIQLSRPDRIGFFSIEHIPRELVPDRNSVPRGRRALGHSNPHPHKLTTISQATPSLELASTSLTFAFVVLVTLVIAMSDPSHLGPGSASRPKPAQTGSGKKNNMSSSSLKKPSAHELRSTYRDDAEAEDDPEHHGASSGNHTVGTSVTDPMGSSVSTRLLPRTDVSAKTISALIRRLRALVVQLIPAEVDLETITGTEGILNAQVIHAFDEAGGDFADAVPFCLIESYHEFLKDADRSDYDLNHLRAVACEILARRIVAHFESSAEADYAARHPNIRGRYEGSHVSLSKRFRKALPDGKVARPRSALESAVDGGCQEFLTSPEAQRTIHAIWRGMIVQAYADDKSGDIFLVRYSRRYSTKFIKHFHPSRLSVPLYQYLLSVSTWVCFVGIYTVATWAYRPQITVFELIMYTCSFGYISDDLLRWIKIRGFGQISVWLGLDICTDVFMAVSFFLRVWSLSIEDSGEREEMHKLSFRVLVSAAPFIWMQLLRIGDCTRFFGVIQVIVIRMLSESAAFFILLILVGFGAAQALWGLNAVDPHPIDDAGIRLVELVLQGVLGAMSFGTISNGFSGAFGKTIAYVYYFILILILRSILVALFGTAFASVQKNANDIYMTFFAGRVIDSIGVPDRHVFVAPFNLIEIFVAGPLSLVLPRKAYNKLVFTLQYIIFFLPLVMIAMYESQVDRRAVRAQRKVISEPIAGDDREHAVQLGEQGTVEDPAVPEDAPSSELQISRVPFSELIKAFVPAQTSEKQHEVLLNRVLSTNGMVGDVLSELKALREEVSALKGAAAGGGKKK
ncbi:unnamed protein product [Tilletia controversa]|nr:hypothetical protein CF335_g1777 [Tilletia laevis]KAE8262529.1 hypothetical protein A4X03_0g2392 [Tilletia caries]CAD6933994.1 unnamed protein product [Tilletia controversa]CAD7068382.1 unnamed protein product [Tilletia caries]